jgi:hypothetical protein
MITWGAFAYRDVGKVDIYDSVVDGNGYGAEDLIYGDNFYAGIGCAQRASIHDTAITGNRQGVVVFGSSESGNRLVRYRQYGTVVMSRSTVSGNDSIGVRATSDAVVSTSTIVDNDRGGVSADRKLVLDATQVTGNSVAAECTSSPCPDVFSHAMPLLSNGSTCGTSGGNSDDPSGSWGVCALD